MLSFVAAFSPFQRASSTGNSINSILDILRVSGVITGHGLDSRSSKNGYLRTKKKKSHSYTSFNLLIEYRKQR